MCQEWLHVSSGESWSLFISPPFPPPCSAPPGQADTARPAACTATSRSAPESRSLSGWKTPPKSSNAACEHAAFPVDGHTHTHTSHRSDAQTEPPPYCSPCSPHMAWPGDKSKLPCSRRESAGAAPGRAQSHVREVEGGTDAWLELEIFSASALLPV